MKTVRIVQAILMVGLLHGFCLSQLIPRGANIVAAEYFVGIDPGLNRATPLSVTSPGQSVDVQISNLSLFLNQTVYVRFRDANGKWSAARPFIFGGYAISRDANIARAEYFIGSDPGLGNGTSINLTAGLNPSLEASNLALSRGQRISFRVRDADGRWSSPTSNNYPDEIILRAEFSTRKPAAPGAGTPMRAVDGIFNSAVELVEGTLSTWNRTDSIWVRVQSSSYFWSFPVGDIVLYNAATSYSTKTISFGSIRVGSFKDTTVTVSNTGRDTLRILGISSTNAAFSARPTSKTVPPTQSFPDTLRFTPSSAGTASALILISSNALSSPDTIRVSGNGILTTVEKLPSEVPKEFSLGQNYPNPFNPSTTIEFALPKSAFVTLRVYDLLGRQVGELVNEKPGPGNYKTQWDARGLASGVYFYRLTAGDFVETKKLLLLR